MRVDGNGPTPPQHASREESPQPAIAPSLQQISRMNTASLDNEGAGHGKHSQSDMLATNTHASEGRSSNTNGEEVDPTMDRTGALDRAPFQIPRSFDEIQPLAHRSISVEDEHRDSTSSSTHSQQVSRWEQFLADSWWPEWLAMAFSILCLIAIAALLFNYDQGDIPQFGSGLTLNAIIATLAVASKSSLLFVVAEAIGQAKWHWYHKRSRPLQDFQNMDGAARGPLGAIVLLGQRTAFSICAIGAVIVIAALAFDPFIQQVVNYPLRTKDESNASTRQAYAIQSAAGLANMRGDVYAGIYSAISQYDRKPTCPSSNCTWPSFRSAGWCSRCEDVSKEIKLEDCDRGVKQLFDDCRNTTCYCTLIPPFGNSLSMKLDAPYLVKIGVNSTYSYQYPQINAYYDPFWLLSDSASFNLTDYVSGNNVFIGEKNPLLAIGFGQIQTKHTAENSLPDSTPFVESAKMTECVLTPCARTYSISVLSGNAVINITHEDFGSLYTPESIGDGGNGQDHICWHPTGVDPRDAVLMSPIYNASMSYDKKVASLYLPNGQPTYDPNYFTWCTASSSLPWPTEIMFPLGGTINISFSGTSYGEYNEFVIGDINLSGGLSGIMPGITAALTNGALFASGFSGAPANAVTLFNGTSSTLVPFVVVRWQWLSLPILLNVFGVVFLALTIHFTRTANLPVWKSSALAVVYHSLEDGIIDRDHSYELASGMNETARSTHVALSQSEEEDSRLLLRLGENQGMIRQARRHVGRKNWWKSFNSVFRTRLPKGRPDAKSEA